MKYQIRKVKIQGVPSVVMDFQVPDDAPPNLKEGIVRRNIVNGGGMCPCGAKVTLPSRRQRRKNKGQIMMLAASHTADCVASDEALLSAYRRWTWNS